jgi:hypothetical protein
MFRKLGGKPKKSILSLDDLQSINPNPTVFPITAVDDLDEHGSLVDEQPENEDEEDENEGENEGENEDENEGEIVTTKTTKRLTPLRKQILELEAAYPDYVLLIRVGEFYEVGPLITGWNRALLLKRNRIPRKV